MWLLYKSVPYKSCKPVWNLPNRNLKNKVKEIHKVSWKTIKKKGTMNRQQKQEIGKGRYMKSPHSVRAAGKEARKGSG